MRPRVHQNRSPACFVWTMLMLLPSSFMFDTFFQPEAPDGVPKGSRIVPEGFSKGFPKGFPPKGSRRVSEGFPTGPRRVPHGLPKSYRRVTEGLPEGYRRVTERMPKGSLRVPEASPKVSRRVPKKPATRGTIGTLPTPSRRYSKQITLWERNKVSCSPTF